MEELQLSWRKFRILWEKSHITCRFSFASRTFLQILSSFANFATLPSGSESQLPTDVGGRGSFKERWCVDKPLFCVMLICSNTIFLGGSLVKCWNDERKTGQNSTCHNLTSHWKCSNWRLLTWGWSNLCFARQQATPSNWHCVGEPFGRRHRW